MSNTVLLFRTYVLFSLLFLIPFSYLTTIQLFSIIKLSSLINLSFNIFNKTFNLNSQNVVLLFNFYFKRKKWFSSICLLELCYIRKVIKIELVFLSLASVYRKLSYWSIAEYYYLKALKYSPNDINILSNLANFYSFLSKKQKAIDFYRKILLLDNSYSIPKEYLPYIQDKSG